MFKGFLTGFIILALVITFILYAYGRKTVSQLSSPQTDAYVEKTTIPPEQETWTDYTPPSKKFSARFPLSPQHGTDRSIDSKTQEPKQYEMYVSENGGKVFMISIISFLDTNKKREDDDVLKNVVDDMVSANSGNKLDTIQYGNYEGHKKADFVITNKSFTIAARAFVDGNQLYVLSALAQTPEESKSEFDHFSKSFKLNSNQPKDLVPFPIEK